MRTFTVVPSFEGESAFFELPDIGFQGDHLSFAILFNLTELVEYWENILPSMIVTNPKGETFIAPHTQWDADKHIFTWLISSTETTYEGYLKCQLKCISADDPETIVCMSRICQTKVYQSLAAAEDPPEAFQTWLDTLVALGAQINADASEIFESVEVTHTNAMAAQQAASEAEINKNAVQQIRNDVENTARIAVSAQEAATRASQQAFSASSDASQAASSAVAANESALSTLEEIDTIKQAIDTAKSSIDDSEVRTNEYMSQTVTARNEAIAAKDAAIVAKGAAETAKRQSEEAEAGAHAAHTGAERAQGKAEEAQVASELAQSKAEEAQAASELAQGKAEDAQALAETSGDVAKKWAIGVGIDGAAVTQSEPMYNNHSKYWAEKAENAKDAIFDVQVTSAYYTDADESITIVIGGGAVAEHEGV